MFNNLIISKDKRGSTILLITVLVLTATFTVTLAAAEIGRLGLQKGRTQTRSTIAYYAAEAGAERILFDVRTDYDIESCPNNSCIVFGSLNTCDANCDDANKITTLGNGSTYKIKYVQQGLDNVITCYGSYKDVTRAVEITYQSGCTPDCAGKVCGDDGCGGSCGNCDVDQSCVDGACVQNPPTSPTNLVLSHTANNRSFTVSWTAGTGNGGVDGCKLQYLQSGSTWNDITSGANVNCDADSSSMAYTLNGDGWKASWNGTDVRLVRKSDSTVMGTFATVLACSSTSGSLSPTPTIDEDCNGAWDNTTIIGGGCNPICEVNAGSVSPGTSYDCNSISGCSGNPIGLRCGANGGSAWVGDPTCTNFWAIEGAAFGCWGGVSGSIPAGNCNSYCGLSLGMSNAGGCSVVLPGCPNKYGSVSFTSSFTYCFCQFQFCWAGTTTYY